MLNIVKKEEPSRGRELLTRLIAVVAALAATGLIMMFLGLNPFTVYVKMVEGATGTSYRLQETINKTIPLLVLSLGTAVAFKMKFWNIGAEGQFYMGAFGAAGVAFACPDVPGILLIPMMMAAGFVCGGQMADKRNAGNADDELYCHHMDYLFAIRALERPQRGRISAHAVFFG